MCFWASHIDQAPLSRRGWVVQERWLSPRILHYGRHQILWECSELSACETYESGLPEPLQNRQSGFKLDSAGLKSVPSNSGNYDSWARIVEIYSGTKLTKPADKLIALSGIAQRMQSLRGDQYLAGLWRRHLPLQLLWSLSLGVVKPPTRPKPYRAPSWSSASLDVGVNFFVTPHLTTSLIDVICVGVTPVTSDATGQIRDGFIRVKGKIFPGLCLRTSGPSYWESIQLAGQDRERGSSVILDTWRPYLDLKVYCLPILSYPVSYRPYVHGLILQAATQGNGTYERIGKFECYNSDLDPNKLVEDESPYEGANGETIMLI